MEVLKQTIKAIVHPVDKETKLDIVIEEHVLMVVEVEEIVDRGIQSTEVEEVAFHQEVHYEPFFAIKAEIKPNSKEEKTSINRG